MQNVKMTEQRSRERDKEGDESRAAWSPCPYDRGKLGNHTFELSTETITLTRIPVFNNWKVEPQLKSFKPLFIVSASLATYDLLFPARIPEETAPTCLALLRISMTNHSNMSSFYILYPSLLFLRFY